MGREKDVIVLILTSLVLALSQQVEGSGHVYVEISVLQYDNPDGTSYNGQNFNGGRKCCDVSGNSNCIRAHSDQCDTYFTFCVGGMSHGRCAGVQMDTSHQVLQNKCSYARSMGHVVEHTGTMTNWGPNMTIKPDILDKDNGGHVDLIDNFTSTLAGISPDKDRLSAKPHTLQFQHLTSLAIELKVWCQDGYGGAQCDVRCPDNYHTCDITGRHKLPLPSCGDPTVISLNLRNVANYPLSTLHDDLVSFLLDNVCPSGTTAVDITFLHIQNNGPVEFRASCRTGSSIHVIRDLDFQLHYFIYYLTYKTTLQRYFPTYNPLPSPPVNQMTTTHGDRLLLMRFVNFHNGDQYRDCTAAGCTTKITICYSSHGPSCAGKVVYTAYQLRSSPNVTSCNSYIMDPAATQNPTSKALDFFRLPTTALTLKVTVQVGSKTVWTTSEPVTYTASQLYNRAVASPVTISSQSKTLQLEIIAWCTLNKWGPQCQFSCQGRAGTNKECDDSGSFTCKTGYSGSSCSDINECSTKRPCQHGATCTNSHGSYTCKCPSGWTGPDCGTDVDECSLAACQNCTNNPGSYTCHCGPGFGGKQCEDVDECSANTHLCQNQATCLNTYGGYTCLCREGYNGTHCQTDIDECKLKYCNQHHSSGCTNSPGTFHCHCNTGWTGNTCAVDIDECSQSNARTHCVHGTCKNTNGGYMCTCTKGYTGYKCDEDINECIPKSHSPCDSNGTVSCLNIPGDFRCNCKTGWTGELCKTDINECTAPHNICAHGRCTNTPGNYTCSCLRGYTGRKCETDIDECNLPHGFPICLNNGTCVNTAGHVHCTCPSGWDPVTHCHRCSKGYTGNSCSDIDECLTPSSCVHGHCTNTPGSFTCKCDKGWEGQHCSSNINECVHGPCVHGRCTDSPGNYTCKCNSGWRGRNCSEDINECRASMIRPYCQHGATCSNTLGSYVCKCHSGWAGHNCSTDVDECSANTHLCQNQTTCLNTNGGYTCICREGYTGTHCQTDIDECKLKYCDEHHSSGCTNSLGSFHCNCNSGWTGKICDTDIIECSQSNARTHCVHGTCINTIGGYTCTCSKGYTGRKCDQDINECAVHTQSPCFANGTVSCINIYGDFRCRCAIGWTGKVCDTDVNECSNTHIQSYCKNGGRCTNTPGNYTCNCQRGYTGRNCEQDIDECNSHPGHNICANNGTCINTAGTFHCNCSSGWDPAAHCHRCARGYTGSGCVDIDECATQTSCVHGTCVNTPGIYTCSCSEGWQGPNCSVDIDECSQQPCLHGSCTDSPGNYTCRCNPGWEGRHCNEDVNECMSTHTCEHGTCTNTPGNYTCQCDAGWQGSHCQQDIDECSPAHVHNYCVHGTCLNLPGNYTCHCLLGYTGRDCRLDIDECSLQHGQAVCANNGTCVNTPGSFGCRCSGGWDAGSLCRDDIDECTDRSICNSTAGNVTCVNNPGSYNCIVSTTSPGYRLEDTLAVSCDDYGWLIKVDMGRLGALRPGSVGSDIYLGDNSCTGTLTNGQLVFRKALDECLTSEKTVNGNIVYTNELVYAEHDPLLPFRIRHYNWTVSVECDINKNQSSTVHLHHDKTGDGGHHVTGSSHYAVNMSFYSDPNFRSPVSGNPLHIPVGTKLYVKVFSTVPDWTIQMKVNSCYTKPNPHAPAKYFYYIIKDGCEVDTNTHFLSQSTHETRFVFEDFEYTTNHEGIYVHCDVIFCEPSDVTPACTLTCDPSDIRPVV